mgnify:CR=1 FL=1|jgi:hypothetical protein
MKSVPEFAIFQNSRTKKSGVWNGKRWAEPPIQDFDYVRLLATLIRTDPNPAKIAREILNYEK